MLLVAVRIAISEPGISVDRNTIGTVPIGVCSGIPNDHAAQPDLAVLRAVRAWALSVNSDGSTLAGSDAGPTYGGSSR